MFLEKLKEDKLRNSHIIASAIDGDKHNKWNHPDAQNDPDFWKTQKILANALEGYGENTFLYTISWDAVKGQFVYNISGNTQESPVFWVETVDFGFYSYLDKKNKLNVYDRQKNFTKDFTINTPKGDIPVSFRTENKKEKLYIDGNFVFSVNSISPFEVYADLSPFNSNTDLQRVSKITYLNETNEVIYTFVKKGSLYSRPGDIYIDNKENILKLKKLLEDKKSNIDNDFVDTTYGKVLTSKVIILDSKKNAVGLVIFDVSERDIIRFKEKFVNTSIIAFFIALSVTLLVTFYLANHLVKPINELIVATEKVKEGEYNYRIVTDSKDEFGILANSFNQMSETIKESNQKLNGYMLDLENKISERTKELTEAKETAEKLTKVKSDFLAYMSHEIRTPMNLISAIVSLLLRDNLSESQFSKLEILKFSVSNLLVIINDILDYSKIEARKIEFEKKEFKLVNLVESIRNSFSPIAIEKNIEFIVELDKRLPQIIVGDSVRLFQILNNLISNAIKFTETGSVYLFLKLNLITKNSVTIDFSVIDTGIGINSENLNSIFESYSQEKDNRTNIKFGSGLGLSITKLLLELQNSKIYVESQIDIGSNFYFGLTFDLPSIDSTEISKEKFQIEIPLNNITLLLVEDYKFNQIVVEEFLNFWNISVDIADNGQKAIEMAEIKDYTIILMDLQMPVLNGYEAAIAIRNISNNRYKNVPIIALTASAMIDTFDKVKKAGMNDFIAKPFSPEELYKKIAYYTSQSYHI